MKTVVRSMMVLGTLIGTLTAGHAAAGEVRFIAAPLAEGRAIWEPTVVLIDQNEDFKGGLVFVLDNPTKTEHSFAVHGLHEMVMTKEPIKTDPAAGESAMMSYTLRPIRVTVPPGETKRITVDTSPLDGHHGVGRHFKFYCPIHRDVHLGGSIYIVD